MTYLITTCSSYACERLKDTSTPSKLAIVIGNFSYKHSPLSTVNADIDAISGQLKKNGYTVDCYQNLYLADLTQLFAHITTSLLTYNGDFLLYLSGHGWNDGTDNYFLAVDVNLDNVNEYKQNSINLDNVMKIFSTGSNSRQAVFIFDICRDNPTGVTTPIGIERNLQKYAPEAKDIIVAYSAGYGTVKAHPVVPGSSISRAVASNPKRGWVRFFREVLIGLGACRSLSGGAAPRAGPSARLCGDCRARRYPSNSTGDGARRARARFRMRRAGRSADCIGRQTR